MSGALGVQRLRYGGGLTLLWSQTLICLLKVTLSVILMQLLSFLIVCHGDSRDFTRIRKPTKERSHGSYFAVWLNLTPSPGLCGDFNEIVDFGEKLGIHDRPQSQMRNFREALSDCGLSDLGNQGTKYTWCNMQNYLDIFFARLDRGVSTSEWHLLLLDAYVRNLPFAFSDHHAVMVDFEARAERSPPKKHLFRFEAAWITREGCEDVIREAWSLPQSGTRMFQLCQKIRSCRMALLQWSKNDVHSLPHQIKEAWAKLANYEANLQSSWNDQEIMRDRNATRKTLNNLLTQEEIYWRQCSRISWMKEGDRYTRYFHACVT